MTTSQGRRVTPSAIQVLPASAPRERWLKERRKGIGGSDAAAVAGVDKYSSPREVYLDKIGALPERAETPRMRHGKRLEGVIASLFAEEMGLRIRRCGLLRNTEHPWLQCTPDRLVFDERGPGLVEIKNTSQYRAHEWDDDQVADAAEIQLQHSFLVTGLQHGYGVALIGGGELAIRRVERDPRLIGHLMDIEADFWDRVQRRDPPPVDGSDACRRLLNELWKAQVGLAKSISPTEYRRLRAEAEDAKAQIKEARLREQAAENRIKELLGEADTGLVNGEPVVTWRQINRAEYSVPAASYRQLRWVKTNATDNAMRRIA
jgi:putative phage-type endonuclease